MKKLILKTALITLGTILAVLCILYGIFALAFPLRMAKFFDGLGMTDASVSFYELQYENTGDIYDLGALCVKIDAQTDYTRAKKYLTLLTEEEGFSSYIKEFDKNNSGSITGEEYFNGKLAVAHQKAGGVHEFLPFAVRVVDNEYSEFNVFYIALSINGLFTEEELPEVEKTLLELEPFLSETEREFILRDLEFTKIDN